MDLLEIFFITGLRLFFMNISTAIYWFGNICGVPTETSVIPNIDTTNRTTIGVELENGEKIIGQNEISHPSSSSDSLVVNKTESHSDTLKFPIKRLFYLNEDFHEICPAINENVLNWIKSPSIEKIVYSIGSLYTSIIPSLVLKGVGEAISEKKCSKLLILNGNQDRESSGMTAIDFISAITKALNRYTSLNHSESSYVTHLVIPNDPPECSNPIFVDFKKIESLGIKIITVDWSLSPSCELHYQPQSLCEKILLKHK